MLSFTKGVRMVCAVTYLLFSILVTAYKATVSLSSNTCLSCLKCYIERELLVGLEAFSLVNWSYKHCQVFNFLEWCLYFLGSISSTTQLNETREVIALQMKKKDNQTHSFLCFLISRKKLALNKRQRNALL